MCAGGMRLCWPSWGLPGRAADGGVPGAPGQYCAGPGSFPSARGLHLVHDAVAIWNRVRFPAALESPLRGLGRGFLDVVPRRCSQWAFLGGGLGEWEHARAFVAACVAPGALTEGSRTPGGRPLACLSFLQTTCGARTRTRGRLWRRRACRPCLCLRRAGRAGCPTSSQTS